MLVNH